MRGLSILRTWLSEYKDDEVMVIEILQCLLGLPIRTRNTIDENQAEEAVQPFAESKDEVISSLARRLVDAWRDLKRVYKIPKKQRSIDPSKDADNRHSHTSSPYSRPDGEDISSNRVSPSTPNNPWNYNRSESCNRTNSWSPIRSRERFRSRSRSRSQNRYSSARSRSPKRYRASFTPNDASASQYYHKNRYIHGDGSVPRNNDYRNSDLYPRNTGRYSGRSWRDQSAPNTAMASPSTNYNTQQSDQLPSGWKAATTDAGLVYYYHEATKRTQWEPPSISGNDPSTTINQPIIKPESCDRTAPTLPQTRFDSAPVIATAAATVVAPAGGSVVFGQHDQHTQAANISTPTSVEKNLLPE